MGIITDKQGNSQFSRRTGFLIVLAHLAYSFIYEKPLAISWTWVTLILVLYGFNKLAFATIELIKYLKGSTATSA